VKLIIFGPHGSGKGSYASRMVSILKITRIAPGDMFREQIEKRTELGKLAAAYLDKGEYVPDDVTIKMIKERLSYPDTKNGFVLDGFPRTIKQAKELEKIAKIDALINIIVPKEILIEIISSRRICSNPNCDGNYNIANIHKKIDGVEYILPPLLPKKEGFCDKCGSSLYQRKDSTTEATESRMKEHEKKANPVLDYYKGKISFINIYMNRPPKEIVKRILEEIKKLKIS